MFGIGIALGLTSAEIFWVLVKKRDYEFATGMIIGSWITIIVFNIVYKGVI